ncbi:XrtA/PEP-CTERM system TPR-repeat protein PrsT [Candidatus Nitrosacidococcus tergens]|uniref:PEP-CTERM system TPR-repeat lipoprotein n=1 Tax=Candidatus Nitrosacidococcus tergens TaxID=553981 RepID=A0A7G1QAZ7_9GAMM|nr:XrtA/PEP-CTERM system TPR-repeat protein PrsT [Candidatus Nitrosacidococcus tergens]CAB1276791.1 PEP-CTERM system TPR-repeat lipoprotein [Candidatus Nitrosacidococcus tergens]
MVTFRINRKLNAVLLLSLFLISCSKDFTPEEYIARAKEYQEKQDISSAIIELKNALQKSPDNAEARLLLGKAYIQTSNGAASEKELEKAIKFGLPSQDGVIPLTRALFLQGKFQEAIDSIAKYPDLPKNIEEELLPLQGEAYLGLNNLEEAKRYYNAALKINPNNRDANLGKAKIEAAQGEFDSARNGINKVLENSPEFAPAWNLLGNLERYQGNAEAAEQAYGKAIEFRKNNEDDRLNRALVRIFLKNYEGAAQDLDILKKKNPNHPTVNYGYGLLNFEQKKYPDAEEDFQKVLNVQEYTPALFYLGLTQYRLGKIEQAEKNLAQFVAQSPDNSTGAKLLGEIRLSKGDYNGAKSILSKVLTKTPNDSQALALMGDVALKQGNPKESAEYFRRVTVENPESALAYSKLGLSLDLLGKHNEGTAALEKARDLNNQTPQADLLVILSYLRAHEFDKAIENAQLMRQKYPENPTPFTLMGGAYLGKGDNDKAKASFEEALKIAPGDPNASHQLASLAILKNNLEEATTLYKKVLKEYPNDLQTMLRLADLEQKKGQVKKTKKLIEQAIETNPKALAPRMILADYYIKAKQPKQALETLADVQVDNSENPALVALTGKAQLAAGQTGTALDLFKKLVRLQPESAAAHYELAKAYNQMGQATEVKKSLKNTLDLDPHYLAAQLQMAYIAMSEEKMDKANEYLQSAEKDYPDNREVINLRAGFAIKENQPEKAIEIYQQAQNRFPDSNYWPIQLSQLYWRTNQQQKSLTTLEAWLKKHPDDFSARLILANNYLISGKNDQARTSFTKLHDQAPEDIIVLNNLAWLMRDENPKRALGYAQQALTLDPENPEVMDTLGTLLLKQGEPAKALKLLEKAAEKLPKNQTIQFHKVQALIQSKRTDTMGAKKLLRDLLSSDDSFLERDEAESLLEKLGS